MDAVATQREVFAAWLRACGDDDPPIVETHVSFVGFTGDRVYKLKKAVRFPFVDQSTPAARQARCDDEVRLNRRLAPDVYLGVAAVTDHDGRTVDHAVEMRRLPDARRLGALVQAGADVDACLADLATRLARLHRDAPAPVALATVASAPGRAGLWRDGHEQMRDLRAFGTAATALDAVVRLALRYCAGRDGLFSTRLAAGRVVDGHGDLLADDVFCLPDGARALDCLEFDARLRACDGLSDAAFLAMDLERLGRADLGAQFLREYARAADDAWPASLAHHDIAYRAFVRSKVAALRAEQGDPEAHTTATALLTLAHDHLERGRVRLVLVGGAPATGKSTLARAMGTATGWPVVRSDVVRKTQAGLAPETVATATLDGGLYTPEHTARVYEELLAQARHHLGFGDSAILDASWSDPAWRAIAVRVADETDADLVAFECTAPVDVIRARAAARAARGGDASDATPEIATALAARTPLWPDAITIDTTAAPERTVSAALARVGRW